MGRRAQCKQGICTLYLQSFLFFSHVTHKLYFTPAHGGSICPESACTNIRYPVHEHVFAQLLSDLIGGSIFITKGPIIFHGTLHAVEFSNCGSSGFASPNFQTCYPWQSCGCMQEAAGGGCACYTGARRLLRMCVCVSEKPMRCVGMPYCSNCLFHSH